MGLLVSCHNTSLREIRLRVLMNFTMPYMSIFSKMKLSFYLWNKIWIQPPNTFFLAHGLYFKVFFNATLKMLTGSSLGTGNLPFLLTWCFSGWWALISLRFSCGERALVQSGCARQAQGPQPHCNWHQCVPGAAPAMGLQGRDTSVGFCTRL